MCEVVARSAVQLDALLLLSGDDPDAIVFDCPRERSRLLWEGREG
jgi:hypothetical protein